LLHGAEQVVDFALLRATSIFCTSRPDLFAAAALVQEARGNIAEATHLLELPLSHERGRTDAPLVSKSASTGSAAGQSPARRSLELALRRSGLARRQRTAWPAAGAPLLDALHALQSAGSENAATHAAQQYAAFEAAMQLDSGAATTAAATLPEVGRGKQAIKGAKGSKAKGRKRAAGSECAEEKQLSVDADVGNCGPTDGEDSTSAHAVAMALVAQFPSSLGAWRTAAAILESRLHGTERAEQLLQVHRSALAAKGTREADEPSSNGVHLPMRAHLGALVHARLINVHGRLAGHRLHLIPILILYPHWSVLCHHVCAHNCSV
jgi:hypothetical protein